MFALSQSLHTLITWIALGAAALGIVILSIVRAEDPARMLFKWVLTALVLGLLFGVAARWVGQGGAGAYDGIVLTLFCALVLTGIWRHHIAGFVARPFEALYDGGNVPPEPRPAYSVAQARQKQGKYLQAVAEIRQQLERFPTDFEGHLLLAQIQAQDLNDLPGAELTIERLCAQPGHAPKNIAFALFSLADWHLKQGRDPEAARRDLEQIIHRLPDTEFALTASQRIAHLGGREAVPRDIEPRKFVVAEGIRNLGLSREADPNERPAEDVPAQAQELVKHLEQHPFDTDARERLAAIYADYYGRLDFATEQLEQLIQQPNQPVRQVTRWLNLLTDIQIRSGADYETVKSTLERIIQLGPHLAAAETARRRLDLLRLELRGKEKLPGVKLGTYDQNIGLNRERTRGEPPV